MSAHYEVFICHRGTETKRNLVSVLNGMLGLKRITSFVDYEMTEGTEINPAIEDAIKNAYVHIVILSPDFENSKWCLEEVFQIMSMQSSAGTSHTPRKVIPIFCDVERSMVRERAESSCLSYNVTRSSPEQRKRWGEAVERLCNFNGFEYNSNVTLQWEKLSEIVVEVENFFKGVDSRNSMLPEQALQRRSPTQDYEVFLCYIGSDTKHNLVSVLRGMLHWEFITCFNNYDMNDEIERKPHIEDAIQKSKVYVILLSPEFPSSKRCLEEVYQIMNTQNSPGTSNAVRSVIPIFYDVIPSDVRYQKSSYDLCRVSESTAHERERWSKSLRQLSLRKGFEFESKTMFQWEELEKIVKAVKTSLKEPRHKNLYGKQLDEVQKMLKSKISEDAFIIGIHGPNKSQFVELLVDRIYTEFDRLSTQHNVIEKVREENGLSPVMVKLFSDLIRIWDEELPKNYELRHERRYKQILRTKKCLVVLSDEENDIYQMRQLVERLKDILSNSSLVVLSSDFKHMLMEVVKVDELIELPSLQDTKGTLIICHGSRFHVHEAYLDHLKETFRFYGLDVQILSVERVLSDSDSARNAKVILCISSNTSSIEYFEKIRSDPAFHSAEIIYVMYGPQGMNKSTSKPCFKVQVNSENSEFNKTEFKTMVNKVVEMFRKGDEKTNQAVVEFPVGLEQRVDEIKSRILDMHRSGTSLQCFGMWGMGGAGKTTIAKSIYNGIHMHFEKSCFCLNTRANFEKGVVDVQRKIIRGLLGKDDRGTEINDEETGETVLECALKGINALIVLDDVDSEKQLDALYRPICSSLGRKSVIIMTSRDCRVLESVQPNDIFEIKGFENREHSERLFYWHAFLKPEPPAHLLQVSSRIIDACHGLPLSLKVMGAHLYGRNDEPYWDESLLWLQQNETDIFKMLRISYNGLETKQKEAFLDICCFLIGEEEGTACSVLQGCYGLGRTYLEVLKNRCLISIAEHESTLRSRIRSRIIEAHDHIRDMGRCIVQEEKRDRAWDEVTAENILKDKKARSTLRGLSISSDFSFPKEATKCRSLPHLKILVVKQVDDRERDEGMFHTKNFFEKVRCKELRWLKWRDAPFRDVPLRLCSKSLRVLDLAWSQIERVPIGSLPNLQRLDLFYCHKLQPFDSSIGKLKDLRYLNLYKSPHVKLLTEEIEGLQSLELLMSNHRPSVFGTSLRTLTSLATTLRELYLWGCESLESLKASSSPPNLRLLRLEECDKLKEVDLEGLQSLKFLHLGGCKSLRTLTSLATTLRTLHLESLKFSSSLPNLRNLRLWECGKLKELDCEGLQSLELLNLEECKSLRTLTSLGSTLRTLDLDRCESLESLKASSSLTYLRDLRLWYCYELKELDCEGLQSLELLILNCDSLRTPTFLATTLRALALYNLKNLESLKAFSFSLPNLRDLTLLGCDNLKELDCEGCCSLEHLELKWCRELESLEMPSLPNLRYLQLCGCDGLKEVDCGGCRSLEHLQLDSCHGLERLQMPLPPNLRHLRLYNCRGLKEVDCGGLPSLQTLCVVWCVSLKRISVLPRSLERLGVEDCGQLQDLDGLDTLTNLRGVRIKGCPCIADESLAENIKRLPPLPDHWYW